ncbi:MFS transporter [Pseudomonas putida]
MNANKKELNRAALASVVGATIEWYDFFLYGVVAGIVFNKLYFPSDDPTTSILLSYSTFAAGFLARPIGGIIFGHFGDKVGRKRMLIITLLVMGISTVAIGLVPTYDQIGIWAPVLLVTFRLIQGIGLGGEWGGGILLAYENAPENQRGFYASLPQLGLSFGVLLSSSIIAALTLLLTEEQFLAWGWRSAFVLSFIFILFGLWIRLKVVETAAFSEVKKGHDEVKVPLFDMMKRYPGNVLLGLGARHIDGVFFNIFSVFSVSYLSQTVHLSKSDALIGVMVASVLLSICIPIFGRLSDRTNRFRFYGTASIVTALMAFPAFWLMKHSEGNLWLIIAAVAVPFGVIYASVYGVVSSFLCGLFDAKVRYTGISFIYQTSSVFAGGLTPIVATLLLAWGHGDPWLVCAYVVASGVMSTLCAFALARRLESQKTQQQVSGEQQGHQPLASQAPLTVK